MSLNAEARKPMDADYEFHPIANAFPLMNDVEFAELIADIRGNGLIKEIDLYQGKVLDGRNRYNACKKAGVPIRTRNFAARDEDHAISHAISANLRRKHYTDDQLSMSAQTLANMKAGDNQFIAKEVPEISGTSDQQPEKPIEAPKISLKDAAKKVGVKYKSAERARTVANKAEAVVEPVTQGKITIREAEKLIEEKGAGKVTEADVQKLIEEKEKPKTREAKPTPMKPAVAKPERAHQKPEVRAAAAAVVDGKITEAEAVRKGIARPVLRLAIVAEEARREIKVDRADLALTAQEKFDAAIRQEKRRLEAAFEERVKAEANDRVEKLALPYYYEKISEADRVIKSRKGFMPHETYKLILACLHPDRIKDDQNLKAKYERAFLAFSNLKLELCNEKEAPTPSYANGVPRTQAEWKAHAEKLQAERVAKKQ